MNFERLKINKKSIYVNGITDKSLSAFIRMIAKHEITVNIRECNIRDSEGHFYEHCFTFKNNNSAIKFARILAASN